MASTIAISSSLDADPTHEIAYKALDTILAEFGLQRRSDGSTVKFTGQIPAMGVTMSEKINLPLIGAIPALANAVVATQIYEARGGSPQTIDVDLRKSHNYLDPDTGMTPTLNGQVSISGLVS